MRDCYRFLLLPLALLSTVVCGGVSTRAEVPVTPVRVEAVGPGGGGSLFQPAVSPNDPRLMFVSCDMSGFYRSADGGHTWTMIDGHMVKGGTGAIVAFNDWEPNSVYVYADGPGGPALRISNDRGVSWKPLVNKPPWGSHSITAMLVHGSMSGQQSRADSREIQPSVTRAVCPGDYLGRAMVVGTDGGSFYSNDAGKSWHACIGLSGKVLGFFSQGSWNAWTEDEGLLAATEDGVHFSSDSGVHWESAPTTGLPWTGIRHFSAGSAPPDRPVLWVTIPSKAIGGKFEGGVYRSSDGGQHWVSAMGVGIDATLGKKDEYGAGDIAQYDFVTCDASHPDTVYVTGSGTGFWPPYHSTVYRSDDGGRNWRYVFTADPRFKDRNVTPGWLIWDLGIGFGGLPWGFAASEYNPNIAVYSNSGELYTTADGGQTWRPAYTRRVSTAAAASPRQAWTTTGLEVTTCWNYRIDPHNPQAHYLCYTDIGFERSEDGGKSWTSRLDGDPWGNTIYDVAPDPAVHGRIWGAASNQHDIPHWTQQEGPSPGAGHGGVVVSDDGGRHWTPQRTGLPDAPATSLVLDSASPPGRRRLWVCLYGSGVYRSDDGGQTWAAKSEGLGVPGNLNSYELQLEPGGSLYCSVTAKRVGNHYSIPGGLWRSRDGGDHWQWLTASLKPLGMMGYAVDVHHPGVYYVTTSSTNEDPGGTGGPAGVFKTTDDGKTWRRLSLLPGPAGDGWSMECYGAFLHPDDPNTVFVTTTGQGVWMSRDGGAHWSEFKAIPFMAPHRLQWDPRDHHILYITTFGGGAWKVVNR